MCVHSKSYSLRDWAAERGLILCPENRRAIDAAVTFTAEMPQFGEACYYLLRGLQLFMEQPNHPLAAEAFISDGVDECRKLLANFSKPAE